MKQVDVRKASLFSVFLSYYAGQMHLFVADLLCAFTIAGIDLAFPQILRSLTRGLFAGDPTKIAPVLGYLALGLVGMYTLRFICRYFVIFWGHVMGARMESRMRQDLFDAYERMSIAYFDRNKTGDLMSRLTNDLFDISEAAHHGPEFILIGVVEVIGSFVILGRICPELTAAMAVMLVVVGGYNVYANWRMRAVYAENRVRIAGVNARLEDALAGMRVTKGFAAEDLERSKFSKSNEAYLDSKTRMYRAMGRYQAAIAALMGALYTVIIVGGGWLISKGRIQAADLATFALYISLFTTPLENILNFTETFQKAFAGFARFVEVLRTRPDVRDAADAKPLVVSEGAISYRNVCFAYPDEPEAPVIRDLCLDVAPGKTVALVGPSGGGKSTTCALLPRFYDVDVGSILIDGQDVRSVTQKSLREAIGLVQQDVYLFDGTIAENIHSFICLKNTFFNFMPMPYKDGLAMLGVAGVELYGLSRLALLGCALVFVVSVLKERGTDVRGLLIAQTGLKGLVIRTAIICVMVALVLAAFPYSLTTDATFAYANF